MKLKPLFLEEIRKIFEILEDESSKYKAPPTILIIINILKNILIKYENNQRLIKSIIGEQKELTDDDIKKHSLVKYDILEKIEDHDGIKKIENLQIKNRKFTNYENEKERITEAAIELLDLYYKMKEKAESEKKIEVVDQKMKKVSVNLDQNEADKLLLRKMTFRDVLVKEIFL